MTKACCVRLFCSDDEGVSCVCLLLMARECCAFVVFGCRRIGLRSFSSDDEGLFVRSCSFAVGGHRVRTGVRLLGDAAGLHSDRKAEKLLAFALIRQLEFAKFHYSSWAMQHSRESRQPLLIPKPQ
mmetsp:Transcript_72717/g.151917  ORF Transcript_72717/g.151917 Transcript_72717/m.151917 type:complete len:126 (-) Transcript_72717:65-442(-)